LTSYCQENKIWTEDRICGQIQKAIVYLTHVPETKYFNIKSGDRLRYGWGYNFMNSEYVAGKLKVEKDEIWDQDREKVNTIFKELGKIDSEFDKITFELKVCRQLTLQPNDPNTIISKFDNDTMLFYLTKKRAGKKGPSGFIYLFFFDKDDKIEKVFKSYGIE
jgi:hypothetical protein